MCNKYTGFEKSVNKIVGIFCAFYQMQSVGKEDKTAKAAGGSNSGTTDRRFIINDVI